MKVKCNWCEWQGDEKEIDKSFPDDLERCPKCLKVGYLMDIKEMPCEECKNFYICDNMGWYENAAPDFKCFVKE